MTNRSVYFVTIPKAPIHLSEAGRLWGYRPKSSGIALTASALKQFRLVVDRETREDRVLQITQMFIGIINDREDVDQSIKRAALAPRVIRERFARWGIARNDDAWCIDDLKATYGYGDTAAKKFLKVFDDTLAFANLAGQEHAAVLAALPTATYRHVLEAAAHEYHSDPGGAHSKTTISKSTEDDRNQLKSAMRATVTPAWRLRRFTYDSNEGTVTLTLPSRLTESTVGKLVVWLQTILQQTDRIPR